MLTEKNMCVCSVTQLCSTLVTPWTVYCHAPLSMESSRQEYWSGLSFPTSGDLHDLETEPASLASPVLAGRFFTTVSPGKPHIYILYIYIFQYTYYYKIYQTLVCIWYMNIALTFIFFSIKSLVLFLPCFFFQGYR